MDEGPRLTESVDDDSAVLMGDADRIVLPNPMPLAEFARFLKRLNGPLTREALHELGEELMLGPSYIETGALLRLIGERYVTAP